MVLADRDRLNMVKEENSSEARNETKGHGRRGGPGLCLLCRIGVRKPLVQPMAAGAPWEERWIAN
jgi:hypothetical protein